MSAKPQFILAWRHNGENHWEAVSKQGAKELLVYLIETEKVNPASIFVVSMGGPSWLCPEYHKKSGTLWIDQIYDEICGTSNPSDYSGPKVIKSVPKEESSDLYGYISPDGRHFRCEYGGHSALARRIVGSMEDIKDASRHLEDKGWLVIYRDPINRHKYAAGMGLGKKITDAQLRTMKKIGLPTSIPGVAEHL